MTADPEDQATPDALPSRGRLTAAAGVCREMADWHDAQFHTAVLEMADKAAQFHHARASSYAAVADFMDEVRNHV